ncbi:MAG: serine/threonine-protein kinase, partial [Myxococcota bacterium]
MARDPEQTDDIKHDSAQPSDDRSEQASAAPDRNPTAEASARMADTATPPPASDRAELRPPTFTDSASANGDAPGQLVAPRPGLTLGHYELIRELGRGGMGAVFLARDTRLHRRVAIKFLAQQDRNLAARFLAEARATARCKHDHIVDIYDMGEEHGHAYMVLEYIEGITLSTWIEERTRTRALADTADIGNAPGPAGYPTALTAAVDIMIPVLGALDHAHQRGLVHRDLKPSNIMLTQDGAVRVLDFGIAKVLADQLRSSISLDAAQRTDELVKTRDGAILGTVPYMSPEQWTGGAVDGRSDLWSVGIILWEMSTGHHPLEPLTIERLTAVADLSKPMPRMAEHHPELAPLAELVDRCLRKRRDERIASARALLDQL